MQLHAVLFDDPQRPGRYARLADVLVASARDNSPDTPVEIHEIAGHDPELWNAQTGRRRRAYYNNARKAKHWREIVAEAPDDEPIGLVDTDFMVLDSLAELADLGADLIYTVDPPATGYLINTGLMIIVPSDRTRALFDAWLPVVVRMLSDDAFHARWRETYGGIHQAAFGYLLENWQNSALPDVHFETVPCQRWNNNRPPDPAETVPWPAAVHIMGEIRALALDGVPSQRPGVCHAAKLWKAYDAQNRNALAPPPLARDSSPAPHRPADPRSRDRSLEGGPVTPTADRSPHADTLPGRPLDTGEPRQTTDEALPPDGSPPES